MFAKDVVDVDHGVLLKNLQQCHQKFSLLQSEGGRLWRMRLGGDDDVDGDGVTVRIPTGIESSTVNVNADDPHP